MSAFQFFAAPSPLMELTPLAPQARQTYCMRFDRLPMRLNVGSCVVPQWHDSSCTERACVAM